MIEPFLLEAFFRAFDFSFCRNYEYTRLRYPESRYFINMEKKDEILNQVQDDQFLP